MTRAPEWYRRLFALTWSIAHPDGEQVCDFIVQYEVETGTAWRRPGARP